LLSESKVILSLNRPDYKTILELDDRINAFSVPSSLPDNTGLLAKMQSFVREHYQALGTSPQYPLIPSGAEI
jgi:hypothetical protein